MYTKETEEDFKLYEIGKNYNRRLVPDYYRTIDINEAFYANDQWKGVRAKGQPTLIMPLYKRIADHEIASILSAPIKGVFMLQDHDEEAKGVEVLQEQVDMLNYKIADVWEKDKINTLLRDCLTDGFNSGDYCIYTYWDKNKNTNQTYGNNPDGSPTQIKGDFCNEVKDGNEIMLGNPNDRRIQGQPYILVIGRAIVSDLQAEAKEEGVPEEQWKNITSDLDYQETAGDRGKIELDSNTGNSDKTLYIIKLWRKDGEVWYRKSTKFSPICKERNMKLNRYPLAWSNWIKRKNSYHGEAAGTAIVPNQIAINQMYSNIVYHLRMTAFGKVIYDSSRIAGWNNAIGSAIAVEGNIEGAVQQLQAGQMNTNMFGFIGDMLSVTKDLNGANDTALGNVNPEQASGTAIMATVQQNAIPLENPKSNLYQFVEDLLLNWKDFIMNKYRIPRKVGYTKDKMKRVGEIKGSDYKNMPLSLKVEVGASVMWSEITSINTIMSLLASQQVTFLQALERMPEGYVMDKQGLIDEINKANKLMEEQQNQQPPQGNVPPPPMGGQPPAPPQGMPPEGAAPQGAIPQGVNSYEDMAAFMETLAPEVRAQLEKITDPNEFEAAVTQLMEADKQGLMQPQGGGQPNA